VGNKADKARNNGVTLSLDLPGTSPIIKKMDKKICRSVRSVYARHF
jgi:hypothetical protein